MKTALYGRIVFGAAAVLFGVVALIWHESDLWHFGVIIAWCLAIAQIAGGIAMMFPQTVRFGSFLLGVVYALFSLACISGMIAAPANYGQYVDFFEMLSIVCGAIAAYAATEANVSRFEVLGRAARIGLGVCTMSFAWAQIVYLQYTASLVPKWIPPNQMFWTILTTIAFALAAVAILIDRQARLAMRLMVLMLALFGVLVWVPHIAAHPHALSNWSELAMNFLITGAVWMVGDLKSL